MSGAYRGLRRAWSSVVQVKLANTKDRFSGLEPGVHAVKNTLPRTLCACKDNLLFGIPDQALGCYRG
jgi:hypothetical protein